MRLNKKAKLAIFVLSTFLTLNATAKVASESSITNDRQAVAAATNEFYAALNTMFTGNVQPMKEIWSHADDTTYMGPNGLFLIGWPKIEQEWDAQAADKLGGQVKPKQMQTVIGADLAVLNCIEFGENVVKGKTETVQIRSSTVFRKEQGVWKVIGHQTDPLGYLVQPR